VIEAARGHDLVVLASGDPFCWGIGTTLARWFGVTESNIDMIFPLLGEFPAASGGFVNTYRDLGFMQPG